MRLGANGDTYNILSDLKKRWDAAWDAGDTSRKLGFEQIACDELRLERAGTPYMYGNDIVMQTMQNNAEFGLNYKAALWNDYNLGNGGNPEFDSYTCTASRKTKRV